MKDSFALSWPTTSHIYWYFSRIFQVQIWQSISQIWKFSSTRLAEIFTQQLLRFEDVMLSLVLLNSYMVVLQAF